MTASKASFKVRASWRDCTGILAISHVWTTLLSTQQIMSSMRQESRYSFLLCLKASIHRRSNCFFPSPKKSRLSASYCHNFWTILWDLFPSPASQEKFCISSTFPPMFSVQKMYIVHTSQKWLLSQMTHENNSVFREIHVALKGERCNSKDDSCKSMSIGIVHVSTFKIACPMAAPGGFCTGFLYIELCNSCTNGDSH